jgi:hypothetical protein
MQLAMGQEQSLYNWAQNVFAGTTAVTNQAIQNYQTVFAQASGVATDLINRYQTLFAPEENQLIQDANTYASEGRVRLEMGAAESDAAQAAETNRRAAEQQLQSYGIDPSSGRYAELEDANRVQAAAAEAGAGQQARYATEAAGRALRQQAIQTGEVNLGQAVAEQNSALQGLAGQVNAALSNAQVGANLMNLPASYLNAAANAGKFAPTSPNTQSQSKQVGGSSGPGNQGNNNKKNQQPEKEQPYNPGNLYPGGAPNKNATQNNGPGTTENPFGPSGSDTSGTGTINPFDILGSESPYGTSGAAVSGDPNAYPGGSPFADTASSADFGVSPTTPFGGTDNIGVNSPTGNPFDPYAFSNNNPDFSPSTFATNASDYSAPTTDYSQYAVAPDMSSMDYSAPPAPDTSASSTDNYDYSGGYTDNYSSGDYGGDYTGDYAEGGDVEDDSPAMDDSTSGGFVSQSLSPSQGQQTDDVNAHLNAEEFVVPKDVARWKGEEYFQKLIQQSRDARAKMMTTGMAARPQPTRQAAAQGYGQQMRQAYGAR